MIEAGFEPIDAGGLTYELISEKIAEGTMPTVIARIIDKNTKLTYAVKSAQTQRLSGLPTVDLARLRRHESVDEFVRQRLITRFGLYVAENEFWVEPLQTRTCDEMGNLSNACFPNLKGGQFIPAFGRSDSKPIRTDMLALAKPERILEDLETPRPNPGFSLLIEAHRAILATDPHAAPVPA